MKNIRKLVNTAIELGGTVYEVAKDSSLLFDFDFMEQNYGGENVEEMEVSEDITLLTEVYVHYPKTGTKERIFLYSEDARQDEALKEEGSIQCGKLVIEYDRLKSLHEKGYRCLYQGISDEEKGLAIDRYRRIFGKQQRRIWFKTLDRTFVGNGWNRALRVRTNYESLIVMPDLYAVRQSIKAFYAENLIRERYEPDFCIERISPGEDVSAELENTFCLLFGSDRQAEYNEALPDSYRKLVCQVTYIRLYYPDVYETVWEGDFEPDDELTVTILDEIHEVPLGICFSQYDENSYAVCRMEDGSIKRVPRLGYSFDTPLCRKFDYGGYGGKLKNPGASGSRMALRMKEMQQSADFMLVAEITKVYVTHIGKLPTSEESITEMQNYWDMCGKRETSADVIAYNEAADLKLDGLGTIMWAAELAEISQIEYVDPVTAMIKAYEKQDERNCLQNDEIGLIYDFGENETIVTIVKRQGDGKLAVVNQKSVSGSNELPHGFGDYTEVLKDDLEAFMLDAGLRVVGINDETEPDAFMELRNNLPRVRRQFKRNDTAKVFFNCSYIQMEEDYPIEKFEEFYKPILQQNEETMHKALQEAGLGMEDIARVYLAGAESEYPFVKKNLEEITNRRVCCINAPECVAARGAALCGEEG